MMSAFDAMLTVAVERAAKLAAEKLFALHDEAPITLRTGQAPKAASVRGVTTTAVVVNDGGAHYLAMLLQVGT